MSDIDTFFQALNQPGVGTIWVRMAEVKDWLLLHGETLDSLKREASGNGFTCAEEEFIRGDKKIHCLKIERARACFKPSLPVSGTRTEASKSGNGSSSL